MKKLFMVVALSLVMVACNKDENEQLTGWDKIVAELGETELSVMDVMCSLRDNELWKCHTAIDYICERKTGNIQEVVLYQNFENEMYGGSLPYLRYSKDFRFCYYKYTVNPDPNGAFYLPIPRVQAKEIFESEDRIINVGPKDGPYSWIEIIAYDENNIIYDEWNYNAEILHGNANTYHPGKRFWYQRVVDDTKWWEKAELSNLK